MKVSFLGDIHHFLSEGISPDQSVVFLDIYPALMVFAKCIKNFFRNFLFMPFLYKFYTNVYKVKMF